jgi:release factor glutamine methyltransferase
VTIDVRVALARRRLSASGIPDADAAMDARLLAQHALGWDAARLVAHGDDAEPDAFPASFEALVERRERREPLAYVTGHREFWGLDFDVSPAVLIPRPETELIVETALVLVRDRSRPLVAADVGTGSGCLAVALAREYPAMRMVATDTSRAALQVARINAERHGVADRVEFVDADLLGSGSGSFDLIVSNPPYVPEGEYASLQPEVRDYEPRAALVGGLDGLAVIERLLATAPPRMVPAGLLIFEFGFGQSARIEQLISKTPGLEAIGLRPDLQGIPRVAIARRVSSSL